MKIPIAVPELTGNEEAYVVDAIRSSWISSQGKYLERFESEYAALCGTRHAIAVSNGTVALHLALVSLGVGADDEVIVPSLTYIASVNAITYVGARPVFVDVSPDSWCMDIGEVEKAVTSRTRAIMAVHLYGQPAEMDMLRKICDDRGLFLIEDAAEAPLATYKGRLTGGLGDIATFSFYGNKLLTSGEGGVVTTDNDSLASTARRLRGQGMDPERRYWFPVIGYNYRMTNVAAAILCAQLERREDFMKSRNDIYAHYTKRLVGQTGVHLQKEVEETTRSPWLYSILIDSASDWVNRDGLMRHLAEAGIETRPFFPPVHLLPPYQNESIAAPVLPVTNLVAASGLNLPTYVNLSIDSVDLICDEIINYVQGAE